MTRTVVAAQSGWGKSWKAQQDTETNIENVDYAVVLDYKDEFRGLCKAGFAQWFPVGSPEARLSTDHLRQLIEENKKLVAARSVGVETWREFCAKVSKVAQQLPGTVLVVVDEAHFVAPQASGYPDGVKSLATTGRGNGVSSTWITQRVQELDETVLSQADARFYGGFTSDRDLNKIGGTISYSQDVHNPQLDAVSGQFGRPVRKYEEGGQTVGSEWIYSTTSGTVERVDTRDESMQSTHYGGSDVNLDRPGK